MFFFIQKILTFNLGNAFLKSVSISKYSTKRTLQINSKVFLVNSRAFDCLEVKVNLNPFITVLLNIHLLKVYVLLNFVWVQPWYKTLSLL